MRFSKYNHEGYHDPTVYEAFTGIEKERKQEKQAVKQLRASYAVYRPIVYICSPYVILLSFAYTNIFRNFAKNSNKATI